MTPRRFVLSSLLVFGGIGILGAGLFFYWWMGEQAAKNAPAWEQVETVKIGEATTAPMQRSLTAVGTVRARRHVSIATEVVGKVVEVGFESGQSVKAGQVLLKLDAATEQADLRAAEATLALAIANFERLQKAAASNSVSQIDLDRAVADRDTARARADQLKALIDKKIIAAPFAGRVGLRDVHPGQHLAEGSTVATLQGDDTDVHVDFALPQTNVAIVPIGTTVSIEVQGQAIPATVSAIDPQVETATRNARFRALAPAMDGLLKPGMFVDVRVPLGTPIEVLTVPATAVRRAPFGDHVFVIKPSKEDPKKLVAHQSFVKSAGSGPGGIIITSGISAGDRVATDGSFKLRDGVTVLDAATLPPPDAASGPTAPTAK